MTGDVGLSRLTYQHTIVAEITPPGRGAVSIVRLSGAEAIPIAQRLACDHQKQWGQKREMVWAELFDPQTQQRIDSGVVLFFRAPASFTGEDVVEFQIHGNPIVVQTVLSACLHCGAKPAEPGEFSRRALLNNKLSLGQAQALGALISATSESAVQVAQRGLQKSFEKELSDLRDRFLVLTSTLMAAIDFPEEGIEGQAGAKLQSDLQSCAQDLRRLVERSRLRSQLTRSYRVGLVGLPNAGKSSLFNALLGEKRSIVTEIAGTTRDYVTESRHLLGLDLTFIDTAGVRQATNDLIEKIGIDQSLEQIKACDMCLYCVDSSIGFQDADERLLSALTKVPSTVLVMTKKDLCAPPAKRRDLELGQQFLGETSVSVREEESIDDLLRLIAKHLSCREQLGDADFVLTRGQMALLKDACGTVESFEKKLQEGFGEELLVEELNSLLERLESCIGLINKEDTIREVFEHFCVGK